MSNFLLAYNNLASGATLSSGSWTAGSPLNNLKTRALKQVARSTDDANASTKFDADLGQNRSVRCVALCAVNLSTAALYRIRVATDAAFTAVVGDSGWLELYPYGTVPAGIIAFEDPRFWTQTPSTEELAYYARNLIHIFAQAEWGRYVRVEIDDTANPDTYVQAGRLFIGDAWQPEMNANYGASIGHTSRSTVTEALDGAEWFTERPAYRSVQFSLSHLSTSEAMGRVLDLQRLVDVHGEVIFVWDPDDLPNRSRRSFLGRLKQLTALEHPYFDRHSTAFEIKELL